ncbi:MAG: type II CRISPR RNA-guided endonuclease Cas9 [Candidatus Thermochlorobacter sp.]
MNYTLGLDIGSSSIGWAMTTDSDILKLGVRIFPEGVEAKSREPKNRTRRQKRLLRRQIARKAMRREMVLHAFQLLGWLPTDSTELEKIWHEDPYALRKKGLDEALSKSELARAFFHLAKRRGFKSNRKAQSDEDLLLEEALETDTKEDTTEKSDNKSKKAKKKSTARWR